MSKVTATVSRGHVGQLALCVLKINPGLFRAVLGSTNNDRVSISIWFKGTNLCHVYFPFQGVNQNEAYHSPTAPISRNWIRLEGKFLTVLSRICAVGEPKHCSLFTDRSVKPLQPIRRINTEAKLTNFHWLAVFSADSACSFVG